MQSLAFSLSLAVSCSPRKEGRKTHTQESSRPSCHLHLGPTCHPPHPHRRGPAPGPTCRRPNPTHPPGLVKASWTTPSLSRTPPTNLPSPTDTWAPSRAWPTRQWEEVGLLRVAISVADPLLLRPIKRRGEAEERKQMTSPPPPPSSLLRRLPTTRCCCFASASSGGSASASVRLGSLGGKQRRGHRGVAVMAAAAAGGGGFEARVARIASTIRVIPDFPKPGLVFRPHLPRSLPLFASAMWNIHLGFHERVAALRWDIYSSSSKARRLCGCT